MTVGTAVPRDPHHHHHHLAPSSMDALRLLHDGTDPIRILPSAAASSSSSSSSAAASAIASPCMARNKPSSSSITTGHYSDDEDEKQARRSTSGSDGVDWARHTFAALPSTLCEIARRSSDELAERGSHSLPPRSAPSSLFRTSAQIEQFRAYGQSCEANELATAGCHAGDAFVQVSSPGEGALWIRGKAAGVEWRVLDAGVDSVHIELLQLGSPASTLLCKSAPNSGGFLYTKVPWGMACGDSYFLRIASAEDPTRFMTTPLFSIGTDP